MSDLYSIRLRGPDTELVLSSGRIDKNLRLAQKWLTQQVANDCDEFIPFRNGGLRSSLTFPEGLEGGILEYNTPYAHYQYMGEVYVNPRYNASGYQTADGVWHGWKGPKVPSGRHLKYYEPNTGDHWFDKARQKYGNDWINGVRRIVGGT